MTTEFTPDGLIDHILQTHHAYMKAELPRLQEMLSQLTPAFEILRPVAAIFGPLKEELDGHLMKEEMVLFPLIRSLAIARKTGSAAPPSHCGSVRNPLRVMLMEHDSAGEALVRMRQLTAGYTVPEDASDSFRTLYQELAQLEADLHRHIHLENDILFPQAVEIENSL